jgi:hypothetical protein
MRRQAGAGERPAHPPSFAIAAALGLVAAAGSLIATRRGVFVTPDSVVFIAAARNLAHGHGLTDFSAQPMTAFGPAYPAVLAAGEVLGVNLLTLGRAINTLMAGVLVVLTFTLLRRHVRTPSVVVGATVLVALWTALLRSGEAMLTDSTFYALTLGVLLLADDVVRRPDRRRAATASMVVLLWAGFLLRYAAAALIIPGAVAIALGARTDRLRRSLQLVTSFVGLALVVPALWIVRNALSSTGTLIGRARTRGIGESPGHLASEFFGAGKQILYPTRLSSASATGISVIVVLGVVLVFWSQRRDVGARLRPTGAPLLPVAALIVTYCCFLAISRIVTGSDLNARLLLPIWAPTIVVAAWLFEALWTVNETGRRWRSILLVAGACAVLGSSAAWFVRALNSGSQLGYETGSAASRAVARDLQRLPPATLVVSNDAWRVYFSSRRQPVFLAPLHNVQWDFSLSVDQVVRATCTRPVYLLWFRYSPLTLSDPVTKLLGRRELALTKAHAVGSGVGYVVTRTSGAGAPSCA